MYLLAVVELDVRALVLHDCRVAAVQVVLLESRRYAAESLKVLRVQSAELLRDREDVHEGRLAALHGLVEAQRVQKLEAWR